MLPQGPPGCVPGNCWRPEVYDLLFAGAVPLVAARHRLRRQRRKLSAGSGGQFVGDDQERTWQRQTDDWSHSIVNGALPTSLDGVSVSMGGKPAYMYFISPGQLNVLAPRCSLRSHQRDRDDRRRHECRIHGTASAYGPAFFLWPDSQVVATRQDYSYAVKAGTFAGATTVPAKPGDVIILWGTGFGPTQPAVPVGVAVPGSGGYSTATNPAVTINNTPVIVYGAALAPGSAGLYQVAIQVPTTLANGDWPIQATIGNIVSPAGTILSVHQ